MAMTTWTMLARKSEGGTMEAHEPAFGAVLDNGKLHLPPKVVEVLSALDIRTGEQLLTYARLYGPVLADRLHVTMADFGQAVEELKGVLGDRVEAAAPAHYHGSGVRPPRA